MYRKKKNPSNAESNEWGKKSVYSKNILNEFCIWKKKNLTEDLDYSLGEKTETVSNIFKYNRKHTFLIYLGSLLIMTCIYVF